MPYVAAVALGAAGLAVFPHSHLALGGWFRQTWQSDLTAGLILNHLAMDGGQQLNVAFWSLRYEVQVSLVFPMLLLLVRRIHPVLTVLGSVGMYALADHAIQAGVANHRHSLDTLKYGSLFAGGALLGRCLPRVRLWWSDMGGAGRMAMAAGTLLLYLRCADAWLARAGIDAPEELTVAVGACGLLVCAICLAPLRSLLHGRVPVYLGRISYSVYLVHGTVLFALLNLLYWKVTGLWLGIVYVGATLAASHLFCIAVEEPALRMGKALAGRWKGQSV